MNGRAFEYMEVLMAPVWKLGSPNKNWRLYIAKAEIEPEVRDLISLVVRKTGLWNTEKYEVAIDLVSHFAEARASGHRSTQEVIEEFGEPRILAALIRRSKKRCRPPAWKLANGFGFMVTAMILVYGWMCRQANELEPAIQFSWRGTMGTLAQPHEPQMATPENHQLVYSDLYIELKDKISYDSPFPGTKGWGESHHIEELKFLDNVRHEIELASSQNHIITIGTDHSDEVSPHRSGLTYSNIRWFLGGLINSLNSQSYTYYINGDRDKFIQNIQAVSGMIRHLGQLTKSELSMANAVRSNNRLLIYTLCENPDFFTPEEMREIAGILQKEKKSMTPNWKAEVDMLRKVCPSVYSNKAGDEGRITRSGFYILAAISRENPGEFLEMLHFIPGDQARTTLSGILFQGDSRATPNRDILMADNMAAWFMLPLIQRSFPTRGEMSTILNDYQRRLEDIESQPWWYMPDEYLQNSSQKTMKTRDRDVLRILRAEEYSEYLLNARIQSIYTRLIWAIHGYKKETGDWPANLEAVVRDGWIDEIPRDFVAGEALIYRVENDAPVLYGRGWDRVDNGGVWPTNTRQRYSVPPTFGPPLNHEGTDYMIWPLVDEESISEQ